MSHARIDCLPPGCGVEEVRCLLQEHGYGVTKIEKTKGSHLSGFEIQFYVKGRKVTFGTSDFEGKKRVRDNVHGYVRASHSVLQDAVENIQKLFARGQDVKEFWERPRAHHRREKEIRKLTLHLLFFMFFFELFFLLILLLVIFCKLMKSFILFSIFPIYYY